MIQYDLNSPSLGVNTYFTNKACTKSQTCNSLSNIFAKNHSERYIAKNLNHPPMITCSVIDMSEYRDNSFTLRLFNENFKRNIKKSLNNGYIYSPFCYYNHVPDIYDINTSLEIRNGRKMDSSYLQTIEEIGGYPTKLRKIDDPSCPLHNDTWHGVFKNLPGHRQGVVEVNRKLIAYVRLRRIGDFAFYSKILGHGDHLRFGVMHLLHFNITSYLCNEIQYPLKLLIYAGAFQGLEGLHRWKREALFRSKNLFEIITDNES